jgi:hypothetical protein
MENQNNPLAAIRVKTVSDTLHSIFITPFSTDYNHAIKNFPNLITEKKQVSPHLIVDKDNLYEYSNKGMVTFSDTSGEGSTGHIEKLLSFSSVEELHYNPEGHFLSYESDPSVKIFLEPSLLPINLVNKLLVIKPKVGDENGFILSVLNQAG